ncbi:MAG TPA: sulfur carrier protein ThiS adenylyltransferase ThiF [Bacteroidales bacterium]|nr:sulfur carrier protein ThiS adenylyltransferase ThiF [Bacteroidales bacterium]
MKQGPGKKQVRGSDSFPELVQTTGMKIFEIRAHLLRFRVGIAGAGGLGSNCAVALARSGIGTIVISDFDIVEPSNLARQYFFINQLGMFKTSAIKETIARINPDAIVIAHTEMLSRDNIPAIFAGCDVIVEAFDTDSMKEMLVETIQTKIPGIPVIIGSGLAGWGRNDLIRCRKIDESLYVCGDEMTATGPDNPPMAPRVGVVANMQANLVIEILMNKLN